MEGNLVCYTAFEIMHFFSFLYVLCYVLLLLIFIVLFLKIIIKDTPFPIPVLGIGTDSGVEYSTESS